MIFDFDQQGGVKAGVCFRQDSLWSISVDWRRNLSILLQYIQIGWKRLALSGDCGIMETGFFRECRKGEMVRREGLDDMGSGSCGQQASVCF